MLPPPLDGEGRRAKLAGWGERQSRDMANERARTLRKNQTNAERKLWRKLRELKPMGFHFRRQAPVDRYIVDFICYSARLVIELDGGQHGQGDAPRMDSNRDAYLRNQGFDVLRFWNNDVFENTDGVMEVIGRKIGAWK